ncbi:T9SS type A sorting domain-containing protein [Candidatus Poribacteria bacterium]|nr:T9SS type A sorting domain-containing protein [Candidatus Poribacteria bacterium]
MPDKTNPVAVLSANATSTKDLTLIAPNTTGEHFYIVCVDAVPGEVNPDTNCYESWVTITVQQLVIAEDVNGDGVVDILDLVLVDSHFGETGENGADVNEDGIVNIADLLLVAKAIGNAAGAPSIQPVILNILTAEEVQQWLTAARKLPNWPAYQRGIVVLEQLLAMLIPKETALLPNYPNPFNPETWIPYHLAEAAEVSLAIYAVDGTVVRTLLLGHQAVGIYQDRKRAAYWDGRNTQGEPVASGVYFYTLKAGDFTTTRKMLIRK